MRFLRPLTVPSSLLLAFASSFWPQASAQTAQGCSAARLPAAARVVAGLRHQLHTVAVNEFDPAVPPAAVGRLTALKAALAEAAAAAMACASPTISPEALQTVLGTALHANRSDDSETVLVTPNGKDLGAYGSDLDVQVLPLASAPRYLEIDFRFGIECGDDNLLLVFRQENGSWQELLRWGAPPYTEVSGAYGDFVLLTPITGLPPKNNWRVVVAHGSPGCKAENTRSHFALDLLQPTADPVTPTVAWHLDRPYRRGDAPRMATTEETLTFELRPPTPADDKPRSAGSAAKANVPAPAASQIYRYRITADNQVTAIEGAPGTTSAAAPATVPVMPGSPATATQPSTPAAPR